MSKYVKIYYGPYESFRTISQKSQKIRGLRDKLITLGFRVDIAPVELLNHLSIEMMHREVFRGNIKYLKFNTSCELGDPFCEKAVRAVTEASVRFQRADDYLWIQSLLDDELFKERFDALNYYGEMQRDRTCLCKLIKLTKIFTSKKNF